jgi:hypothetical protein
VPLGVPVQYRAEQFNSAGTSLGFTAASSVQIDIDPSMAVFQDPLHPARAVLVEAKADFAGQLVEERAVQLQNIGTETIALMGQMGLLSNIPLTVQTKSLDDAAARCTVLLQTQILVRTMPRPVLIPRCLHVVIPEVRRTPVNVHYGGEWVQFPPTGHQVTRSPLAILVGVVNYELFNDYFATYTAFNTAYSSYLDAIANPPAEV